MSKIYIFGSGNRARVILDWLLRDGGIGNEEITAITDYSDALKDSERELLGVPIVPFESVEHKLSSKDIVIIASQEINEAVESLFQNDFYNVFDGTVIIDRYSIDQRFLNIAEELYIGPTRPTQLDPDHRKYRRYSAPILDTNNIPRHKLFMVNSMPKSGTVWMMAMIEAILNIKAHQQIILSHVQEIENQWAKQNLHGGVVLVRDMRDIAVSWFHHLCRSDLQNGFCSPRYPDIESFYYEHFIGQVFGCDRYYFGDLEKWLDFVCINNIPIVKYEELIEDTQSCLKKIMTFWKVRIEENTLREVAQNYRFENIKNTLADRQGYISDIVKSGHMRHGTPGSWKEEMPAEIAYDINKRFLEYQRRLGYIDNNASQA